MNGRRSCKWSGVNKTRHPAQQADTPTAATWFTAHLCIMDAADLRESKLYIVILINGGDSVAYRQKSWIKN
jgi:hypothetical protein